MSEVPAAAVEAAIAKELEDRGFMGWFVANANSALWAERSPEQEIARVAYFIAAPLIRQATADKIAAEIEAVAASDISDDISGLERAAWIARRVGGGGGGGQ
jgi:hypothetical protein